MSRDLTDNSSEQQIVNTNKAVADSKNMTYTKTRVMSFDSETVDDVLEINDNDVDILLDEMKKSNSSNGIIVREMARHLWEKKFYFGKIIDFTVGQEYLAYVVQRREGLEKIAHGIRVTEIATSLSQMIKLSDNDDVVDLAFSQDRSQTLLSFITKSAKVHIFQINNLKTKLECKPYLVIGHRNVPKYSPEYLKIVWCPFDIVFDNTNSTLIFTCLIGKKAFIYDLNNLTDLKEIDSDEIKSDFKFEIGMKGEIIFGVISPDATTFVYTSTTGDVDFYKLIFFETESPQLLFNWKPHENVGVTNLFFLNGPVVDEEDPTCWSFVVTVTEKNELKLWSCLDWKCIQTIRFKGPKHSLRLRTSIDMTSEFILISDLIYDRLMVIPIEKNQNKCLIRNVYQFHMKDAILSLCATQCQPSHEESSTMETIEAAAASSFGYQFDETALSSYNSYLVFYYIEHKTICKGELVIKKKNFISELDPKPIDDLTLMTPDDFNVSETTADVNASLVVETITPATSVLTNGTAATTTTVSAVATNASDSITKEDNYVQDKLIHFTSSSSSPSREVEEILSVRAGNENILNEYYDNANDSTNINEQKSWSEIPMKKSNIVIESEQNRSDQEAATVTQLVEIEKIDKNDTSKTMVATTMERPDTSNSLVGVPNVVETTIESFECLENQQGQLQSQQQQKLYDLLEKQTSMILKLENEIRDLNNRFNKDNVELLKKNDSIIDKIADRVNKIHFKHEKKSRDDVRNILMDVIKAENERNPATASNPIDMQTLEKMIMKSVSDVLKPDMFRQMINAETDTGFQRIERVLSDQVTKAVTNKYFIGQFTKAISGSLKTTIEQILSDEIALRFVPAVEKICCEMFKQIHANFEKGTTEYLNVIDQKISKISNVTAPEFPLKEMENMVNESMTSKMTDFTSNINSELKKITSELERSFTQTLSSSLLNTSNQTSAIQSRSVTPSMTPRVMAFKALNALDYNTAFHIALASTNLELVNEICYKVSPVQMFHDKNIHTLQPTVIISLLQQLSHDLFNHTKLKLEYLEEALTNFSRIIKTKQINRSMLDKALQTIRLMLKKYRESDPDSLYLSKISRIELMIEPFLQTNP